jgi:hypothetical protein
LLRSISALSFAPASSAMLVSQSQTTTTIAAVKAS